MAGDIATVMILPGKLLAEDSHDQFGIVTGDVQPQLGSKVEDASDYP
ncbi:MAG: hypothetical protein J0H48_05500 [Nitrosospira multiformis]|nr:hypothetical protein [Nitrosospira multiformis]